VLKISIRDCLKDKGSFHKESRQCKISPSLFNSLKNSDLLDPDSERSILNSAFGLLSKMIDVDKTSFQLTLLGMSVTDFVASTKRGIQTYFAGNSTGVHKNRMDIKGVPPASPFCREYLFSRKNKFSGSPLMWSHWDRLKLISLNNTNQLLLHWPTIKFNNWKNLWNLITLSGW